jgi:hypothetical protein
MRLQAVSRRLDDRQVISSTKNEVFSHCESKTFVTRRATVLLSAHAQYPSYYPYPSPRRSFSRLGLQFRVGLLSLWRSRIGAAHCPDSRGFGKIVATSADPRAAHRAAATERRLFISACRPLRYAKRRWALSPDPPKELCSRPRALARRRIRWCCVSARKNLARYRSDMRSRA